STRSSRSAAPSSASARHATTSTRRPRACRSSGRATWRPTLPDSPAIPRRRIAPLLALSLVLLLLALQGSAGLAHDISDSDRAAVAQIAGPAPFAFLYLGAKHMVT